LTCLGAQTIQRAGFRRTPTTEISSETHLSTERTGTQASPWIPQPHVDCGRPARAGTPPRQGSQAPVGLTMSCPVGHLKTRPQFLRVAAKGKKWATPGLVLQACRRPAGDADSEARYGLTASRKVGSAVTRNRARRRLRAAAEKVLPRSAAGGYDYVLIARASTVDRSFGALVEDLETALKRLGLFHNHPGHEKLLDEKGDGRG